MNKEQIGLFAQAVALSQNQTEAQVIALFLATWRALGSGKPLDDSTIRRILDEAESEVPADQPRTMIQQLRRRAFPN